MPHQDFNEIANLIMHMAMDAVGPRQVVLYGHIVGYDPKNHAVKVQIPTLRIDEDHAGIITPWIPLGTPFAGNGYGAQYAPEADASGIASATTPTGTPCEVILNEQDGAAIVSAVRFTDKHQAPFPNMKPGEAGHMSIAKSSWYLDKDGNWNVKAVPKGATLNSQQVQTKDGSQGSQIIQKYDGSIDIIAGGAG